MPRYSVPGAARVPWRAGCGGGTAACGIAAAGADAGGIGAGGTAVGGGTDTGGTAACGTTPGGKENWLPCASFMWTPCLASIPWPAH